MARIDHGQCDSCGVDNYACPVCGVVTCKVPCDYCSTAESPTDALVQILREGLTVLRERGVVISDSQIEERARNLAQGALGWHYEFRGGRR